MTRTFIAVELDDAMRAALARLEAQLAQAAPSLRWTEAAKLHLTLAFLGELDDPQVQAATDAAYAAASGTSPFRIVLAEPGYFGPRWAPRVLWAGVGGATRDLLATQTRLANALAASGFPLDQRPFAPHLTLARIKQPLPTAELERLLAAIERTPAAAAAMTVMGIAVMKSELARDGARYTRLAHCSFRSA